MKEEWKVYIKGVPGRGKEVIKTLRDLGGKETPLDIGGDPSYIYYISHEGDITCMLYESEAGKIIMDFYREVKLPERWKDGDILVNKNADYKFCVFDDYLSKNVSGNDLFFFHCEVARHKGERYLNSNNRRYFHDVNDYRLATPHEVERFHEALHKYHKDWDAEKKQLVNYRWMPKEDCTYYYVNEYAKIVESTWYSDIPEDRAHYEVHNCFRTKEEAEAAAERAKKALKGE